MVEQVKAALRPLSAELVEGTDDTSLVRAQLPLSPVPSLPLPSSPFRSLPLFSSPVISLPLPVCMQVRARLPVSAVAMLGLDLIDELIHAERKSRVARRRQEVPTT